VCKDINIELAEDCPEFEKAFTDSSYGKVLGKFFDKEKMAWMVPEEKRTELIREIESAHKYGMSTKQLESLLGKLNDIGIMCPFLKSFRSELYRDLCQKEKPRAPTRANFQQTQKRAERVVGFPERQKSVESDLWTTYGAADYGDSLHIRCSWPDTRLPIQGRYRSGKCRLLWKRIDNFRETAVVAKEIHNGENRRGREKIREQDDNTGSNRPTATTPFYP
jgi:hypothetical protein